jgi:hypothetical protein
MKVLLALCLALVIPNGEHQSDLTRLHMRGKVSSCIVTRSGYTNETGVYLPTPPYLYEKMSFASDGSYDLRLGGFSREVYSQNGDQLRLKHYRTVQRDGTFFDYADGYRFEMVSKDPGEEPTPLIKSLTYEYRNYNEDNLLSMEILYDLELNSQIVKITYGYDSSRRVATKTVLPYAQWTPSTSIFTYYPDHVVEKVYGASLQDNGVITYYLSTSGLITTSRKDDASGSMIEKHMMSYNSRGDLVGDTTIGPDSKAISRTVWLYSYDSIGNWITCKEIRYDYSDSKTTVTPIRYDCRSFVYYAQL